MDPRLSSSFDPIDYMCMESVGSIAVGVRVDRGSLQVPTRVRVKYKTIADSAQEHEDFVPVRGELVFQPEETQ